MVQSKRSPPQASPTIPAMDKILLLARPEVQSLQRQSLEGLPNTSLTGPLVSFPELQYQNPETLPYTSLTLPTPELRRQILETSPIPPVLPKVRPLLDPQRQSHEDLMGYKEKWHDHNDARPWRYSIPGVRRSFIKISASTYKFVVICTLVTLVVIAISLGPAVPLMVPDIEDRLSSIPFTSEAAIGLEMRVLSVDPISGTLVLEWYTTWTRWPSEMLCLYVDPNLSATPNPNQDDPTNTAVASDLLGQKATFCFSSQAFDSSLKSHFPSFRTASKLIGRHPNNPLRGSSLQAYPFDRYYALISIFAFAGIKGVNNTTTEFLNATGVHIVLGRTWGVAVGFEVQKDPNEKVPGPGLGFALAISRSRPLQMFVVFIVLANWLFTIVFIWITIACAFWGEKVVKEIFVVPVSVLFAFTAARSSFPGAPAGFGAFIDFIGILPNIAVVTVCSCLLLILVTCRRIKDNNKDDDHMQNIIPQIIYCSSAHRHRPGIPENLPV